MMFKVIASLLFLATISLSSGAKLGCEESLVQADHCLKKLLYVGDWNLTLIENEGDLLKQCRESKKHMACIKRYQKCLTNFPREVFNLMSRNARKLNRERCEDPKGKAEFLKHIKCLDSKTITINTCMDQMIVLLEYIADNIEGDRDTMLRSTCCSVHLGLSCFTTKVSANCKKTGDDTAAYVTDKINSMVADVFDLACAKYPDIATCDKSVPDLMASFRNVITPASKVPRQSISPLIPLMKVVKKIEI